MFRFSIVNFGSEPLRISGGHAVIADRDWVKPVSIVVAVALFGCAQADVAGGRGVLVDAQEGRKSMSVPRVYENVTRLQILCAVQSDRGIDYAGEAQLCEMIRSVAADGSPVDVAIIAAGDPKVLAANALTLIVHAGREGDALAVSIRPYRVSNGSSDVLFGARPFIVPVADPDLIRSRTAVALDEILPWRARAGRPQPMD